VNPHHEKWSFVAVLAIGIALKLLLLATSQSMPDGDEAVEGLMAMHMLRDGVHRLYPYGVRYGAGAGVETHAAAALFAVAGPSGVALKTVGLVVWSLSLLLLIAIVRKRLGQRAALLAGALYAVSPAGCQWAMKVGGGHQIAVALGLLTWWLNETVDSRKTPALAWLVPLVALAHPIAAPFALFLAGSQWLRTSARLRPWYVASLALAVCLELLLLAPTESGVWDPSAASLAVSRIPLALGAVATSFFSPNLNGRHCRDLVEAGGAIVWLTVLCASLWALRRDRELLASVICTIGVVVMVNVDLLVPRHLLLLHPIGCMAIAQAVYRRPGRQRAAICAGLITLGLIAHVRETRSPYVYGPAPQHNGVSRAEFRTIIDTLQSQGIKHVYSLDPMLQWNVMFATNERILARWKNPADRVPRYARLVDQARLNGEPIAVVGDFRDRAPPGTPQKLGLVLQPDQTVIGDTFPLSSQYPQGAAEVPPSGITEK
jgi:hypothetical protein